jgi:hypothetical protein
MKHREDIDPEQSKDDSDEQELEDLDVGDDADKVIGGAISCPCEGGEIQRPR